jgi:hypothetical protein
VTVSTTASLKPSAWITVGAFDPAMSNLGYAMALIDPVSLSIKPFMIGLVVTENEAGKQVRKNSDDLRRAMMIFNAMAKIENESDILMSEIPTGTQSARGAMGNGMMLGCLSGLKKPLIQVQPTETKIHAVGRKTATKDEMIVWAMKLYPDLEWKTHKKHGVMVPTASNEHMADALGVIHAGVKTAEFKSAVAMFNAMKMMAQMPHNIAA